MGLSGCQGLDREQESSTAASLAEKLSYDAAEQPDPIKSVVYVSGSWKDMGRQFAEKVPDALKRYVTSNLSAAVASYGLDGARELESAYLKHYEEHAPQLVELYRGMAEELNISYEDFMLGIISFHENPAAEEDAEAAESNADRTAEGCSTVAAWGEQSKDGNLIVGADWDSIGAESWYMPTVIAYPDDGNAFISESGFQGNLVMNEHGLVCAGSSGQNAAEDDTGMGIPVMTSQWLVAATCSTVPEAQKAYLESYTTVYGDNASYHDLEGGHVVIEATKAHNATRASGDFGEKDYLIATNDFMTDEMQNSLLPAGSGYDDCRPRYWTEERVLLNAKGKATERTIADALAETGFYADGAWTHDNWNLETGLNSPEAISPHYQNVMKAIAVPEEDAYYVMNGCVNKEVSLLPDATGTYVQVKLCASPAESAAAARETANGLIFDAGSRIAHADDPQNAAKASLNAAKQAQIEGDNLTSQAGVADGKQAQALLGKAATAYLRVQSHAQEALGDNQAVLDR